MAKRICVKCETEFRPEINGVIVAEMFQKNQKIYKLWEADLWKCPLCGFEIIAGFAQYPFTEHFKDNCEEVLEKAKQAGRKIVYDYELTGSVAHKITREE